MDPRVQEELGELFFSPESTKFSKEIPHDRERFSAPVTLPFFIS